MTQFNKIFLNFYTKETAKRQFEENLLLKLQEDLIDEISQNFLKAVHKYNGQYNHETKYVYVNIIFTIPKHFPEDKIITDVCYILENNFGIQFKASTNYNKQASLYGLLLDLKSFFRKKISAYSIQCYLDKHTVDTVYQKSKVFYEKEALGKIVSEKLPSPHKTIL